MPCRQQGREGEGECSLFVTAAGDGLDDLCKGRDCRLQLLLAAGDFAELVEREGDFAHLDRTSPVLMKEFVRSPELLLPQSFNFAAHFGVDNFTLSEDRTTPHKLSGMTFI